MRLRAVLFALLIGWMTIGPATAEEPARQFLDGLRARGFHDVALEYLDQLAVSPLAPREIKEVIAYEKALTLVAASRSQRDPEASKRQLDQAKTLLQQFIAEKASHPKANAARSELGSLIFERARLVVKQSRESNDTSKLREARRLYDEAFEVFVALQKTVNKELSRIPKVLDTRDRKQARLAEQRKQLRADNLQTELLAAAVREETADTLPDGSAEQTKYLNEAAKLYDGIYKNYRGRLAGFYARMYQGRCNQRLGKLKDALGFYGELLDQPNESEGMFVLKTKTLRLAMECWLAPSQKKYVETIKQGESWLAAAPKNQDREADWLAIRLGLARAYKMQADAAQKSQPQDSPLLGQSVAAAMRHAKFVANETGEFQEQARQLVTSLGGISVTQKAPQPRSFYEAQVAGKEALDKIAPAQREIQLVQSQWAAAQDADAKPRLQARLTAARKELEHSRDDAITFYRLALQLADRDTPPSDINLVRYFLCYLYYLKQDYFEAALVGDFVSSRYLESAAALQ
ncbi:MAG: hypothetical protein MI861_10410, partial [Pirellulales bacterium]|nr:hypothetical protein [Pirellulales bacterium]